MSDLISREEVLNLIDTAFESGALDDVIKMQAYILDVLMAYREISKLPTCNECAAKNNCPQAPKPGQMVRYNCFAFVPIERWELK